MRRLNHDGRIIVYFEGEDGSRTRSLTARSLRSWRRLRSILTTSEVICSCSDACSSATEGELEQHFWLYFGPLVWIESFELEAEAKDEYQVEWSARSVPFHWDVGIVGGEREVERKFVDGL